MIENNQYKEFFNAAEETDFLGLEGFFGKKAKQLIEKRDSINIIDFHIECLEEWIKDTNQYGKEEVKKFILIFMELFSEALESGGQKTVDILTAFFKGFSENPETECLSSYTEFIRSNVETRNLIKQLKNKKSILISDKKRLGDSLLITYRRGTELIGKILTVCILLKQISEGKLIEPLRIYNKFLGEKIKQFRRLSNGKYDLIINSIDKDLRNAEAHLDVRFETTNCTFYIKVRRDINGKKQIKIRRIKVQDLLLHTFPIVGWISQAFVYTCSLLVICDSQPEKYKDLVSKIYEI